MGSGKFRTPLILGFSLAYLADGCGHGRQFLYPSPPQGPARVVPGVRSQARARSVARRAGKLPNTLGGGHSGGGKGETEGGGRVQ